MCCGRASKKWIEERNIQKGILVQKRAKERRNMRYCGCVLYVFVYAFCFASLSPFLFRYNIHLFTKKICFSFPPHTHKHTLFLLLLSAIRSFCCLYHTRMKFVQYRKSNEQTERYYAAMPHANLLSFYTVYICLLVMLLLLLP